MSGFGAIYLMGVLVMNGHRWSVFKTIITTSANCSKKMCYLLTGSLYVPKMFKVCLPEPVFLILKLANETFNNITVDAAVTRPKNHIKNCVRKAPGISIQYLQMS